MAGDIVVRELVESDLPAAWELGRLAFGGPATPPDRALELRPGATRWGAFDASGRLVGKATDLHHDQWWSGARVPAADIGGVAVLAEARGRGVARLLLGTLLAGARDRGAAVSALFPTVSAVYRANGWAMAGTLRSVDVHAADLVRARPSQSLTVRPGGPADLVAVHDLYTAVATPRHGMLTRDGTVDPSADGLPGDADGLTLVEDGDRLAAYALWTRGDAYGRAGVLTVSEALATGPDAARELLDVLASWRTVTPTLRLGLLPGDAVSAEVPLEAATEHRASPWMHRPVDVVAALTGRTWPADRDGGVAFTVEDAVAPWNAGRWELEIAGGVAGVERAGPREGPVLTVAGLGLLLAGVAPPAVLAQRGLLRDASARDVDRLGVLLPGTGPDILDYF